MSKNLLSRYIWIIDTIRRHGTLTRDELNALWERSEFSDGEPLPRRTFYNYRNAIEDIFRISIECNPSTFEYYIAEDSDRRTDARDIADRVFLEDIPSARQHLSTVIRAMKELRTLKFGYSPYTRSGAPKTVVLEPYFLKIFRLRWYITGRNVREDSIKTYALDRMSSVNVTTDRFTIPFDFDAESYFRDAFGIVFSQGEPRKVIIRTDPRQAKYFRALPLHHSQSEMVHDNYSVFTYRLRLTPDLVQELLSYGPRITVEAPAELRAMMVQNLRDALRNYE